MNVIKKIWENRWVLRSLHKTIFFNFHYLPFKQAIRLPIWLYKPSFGKLKGSVSIDNSQYLKPGMIRMGYFSVDLYANNGIYFNNSGKIVFKGSALIGNNCYISNGSKSTTIFGNDFRATTSLKLSCYHYIEFGEHDRFGWDCLITDTDFHKLSRKDGTYTKGYNSIIIGKYNWFGNGCHILKGTKTPDYLTIQAGTWFTGKINIPEYSVVGNKRENIVLASDVWLDPQNEKIEFAD